MGRIVMGDHNAQAPILKPESIGSKYFSIFWAKKTSREAPNKLKSDDLPTIVHFDTKRSKSVLE